MRTIVLIFLKEPHLLLLRKNQGQGALSGVDPNDPGVDISSFMGKSSLIWSKNGR